jgi:hypothetical protein
MWFLIGAAVWVVGAVVIAVGHHFLKAGAKLYNPDALCKCDCPYDDHEHYRPGTECSYCGEEKCPAFRPKRGVNCG